MRHVVIVGAQWGDEGKGKVVDWLSNRADVVVRFQGGHNAGHTLVVHGIEYHLSLLPAGVVRPDKLSVIGNGVVIDPWVLLEEMAIVGRQGFPVTPDRLRIAETACLILPFHAETDRARELARGAARLGTMGRGIGPAYEDKAARRAIRLCDLADPVWLRDRLVDLLVHHNALRRGLGAEPVALEPLLAELLVLAPRLLPFTAPTGALLAEAAAAGKRMLFEGAQGVMLDLDHGTYPFVTSSNTGAAAAASGTGLGPRQIGRVVGLCKAYATRVGNGPLPTEQGGAIGEWLGKRGREQVAATGRLRRCGWLDAVLLRHAVRAGGIEALALTKLDVLDGMHEVQIAVGYECDGVRHDALPALPPQQARVRPIYQTLPGWQASTRGARAWDELPPPARAYVNRIEELAGVPVTLLSTSPERDDMIMRADPFAEP